MNSLTAEKTLFDFHTCTNAAAWQVVNDAVMGGVSTCSFTLTNSVAIFRGEISLENNGGFASVRSLPARHDLAGCDTFAPTRASTAPSTRLCSQQRKANGRSIACQ